VGVLALTQAAEAKIVYTQAHKYIAPKSTVPLDLNHDGVADFSFRNNTWSATWSFGGSLWIDPAGSKNEVVVTPNSAYASALPPGFKIGSQARFSPRPKIMARTSFLGGAGARVGAGCGEGLSWPNGLSCFLGLEFSIRGKTHYGWARLKVRYQNNPYVVSAWLTGYAYETCPNKAIIAGKTKGPDVVTAQPGGLGRLARGSAGLAAGRQNESTNGTH